MARQVAQVDDFPRLIMGMPRAATTWICKCLNEHPEAAAFGESSFWGRAFVEPRPDGRYDREQLRWIVERMKRGGVLKSVLDGGPGSLKRLTGDSFADVVDRAFADADRPTPAEVFARLTRAVAEGEGKPCAIEKTPHHLMWLDRIMEHLPEARCVVMLREPYGFMLSYKHWPGGTEWAHKRFRQRYHPLACALVWRAYMNAAAGAKQRYGNQLLFVQVDEVKRDAEHVLAEVQRFLGLPVVPLAGRVPPDNTSFEGGRRPELRGADVFWMNRVAGRAARRAGYELTPAGGDWPAVAWSIVRLPWWGLQNLAPLRRNIRGSFLGYLWNWIRPRRGATDGKTARP